MQDLPVNLDSMGKFNPVWYAGLRAYFTDDYKGAVRQLATEAGFTRFRRVAQTPFNLIYEIRP